MDIEANKKIEANWDRMAEWYEKTAELFTYQACVTCALMSGMNKAKRSLEVACGPGKHSQQLALCYMKPDG
jgi:ubiquinone/menaquinone biosynthesis C-methylase UbiE